MFSLNCLVWFISNEFPRLSHINLRKSNFFASKLFYNLDLSLKHKGAPIYSVLMRKAERQRERQGRRKGKGTLAPVYSTKHLYETGQKSGKTAA